MCMDVSHPINLLMQFHWHQNNDVFPLSCHLVTKIEPISLDRSSISYLMDRGQFWLYTREKNSTTMPQHSLHLMICLMLYVGGYPIFLSCTIFHTHRHKTKTGPVCLTGPVYLVVNDRRCFLEDEHPIKTWTSACVSLGPPTCVCLKK